MRPRYVTEADKQNERAGLDLFLAWMNKNFSASGTYTGVLARAGCDYDWAISCNGVPCSVVEFKRRKGLSTRYDTWHFAKDKFTRLTEGAARGHTSAAFVFQWDDGFFVTNLGRMVGHTFTWGGRTDRGDVHDLEELVNIPRENFKKFA